MLKEGRMLKKAAAALGALLILFAFALPAFANSPIPPTLAVYTDGLPEDAELSLTSADGAETVKAEEIRGVYNFYFENRREGEPTLRVTADGSEYSFTVTEEMLSNGATLTFGDGQPELHARPSRAWLQVLVNVLVTLAIEFFVLLLFGYRKGRTFLIFLITNLFTQALYNALLVLSPFGYDFLIELLIAEAIIIIVEGIIYSLTVALSDKKQSLTREHSRGRAWGYAITANLVSMTLGTVIILIISATLFD